MVLPNQKEEQGYNPIMSLEGREAQVFAEQRE